MPPLSSRESAVLYRGADHGAVVAADGRSKEHRYLEHLAADADFDCRDRLWN